MVRLCVAPRGGDLLLLLLRWGSVSRNMGVVPVVWRARFIPDVACCSCRARSFCNVLRSFLVSLCFRLARSGSHGPLESVEESSESDFMIFSIESSMLMGVETS